MAFMDLASLLLLGRIWVGMSKARQGKAGQGKEAPTKNTGIGITSLSQSVDEIVLSNHVYWINDLYIEVEIKTDDG